MGCELSKAEIEELEQGCGRLRVLATTTSTGIDQDRAKDPSQSQANAGYDRDFLQGFQGCQVLNAALEQGKDQNPNIDELISSIRSDRIALAAARQQLPKSPSDELERAAGVSSMTQENQDSQPEPLAKKKKSVSFSKTVSIYGWTEKGRGSKDSMLKQFVESHSSDEICDGHGSWCKYWALQGEHKAKSRTLLTNPYSETWSWTALEGSDNERTGLAVRVILKRKNSANLTRTSDPTLLTCGANMEPVR